MTDKPKDEKPKQTPYELWLTRLKPEVAEALINPVTSVDVDEFTSFADSLSADARAAVMLANSDELPSSVEPPPERGMRYGVVECFSGEFPVLKMFKTAERMATYLKTLEGRDVVVWCFYGQNLPITVGPRRYVLMGDKTVSVPIGDESPTVVDTDSVQVEIQDDGFMGPPELAQTPSKTQENPDDEEDK